MQSPVACRARRGLSFAFAFASLVLAAAACGGSPPPPTQAPVASPKEPAALAAPIDTSAVAAPRGLVALGRVRKPTDVLAVMGGWTHVPMPGSKEVSELVAGESVGKVVDLDQPIDVALATDPTKHGMSLHWAMAAAVRSLDEAKATLSEHFKLVPGDNGAIVVQGVGGSSDADDEDESGRKCELAPAAGAASTRLVCAGTDAGLRMLAPYLTRTVPRDTAPSDVHIELRFEPLQSYAAMMRGMVPSLLGNLLDVRRSNNQPAAEAIDAFTGEMADLLTDLDTLTLDAKLDDALARFDAQASFKTAKSLMARLATGHADRVDLPPATFWRLPVDTDLAFFMRGIDTRDIEHPRDLMLAVLGHALEQEGLGEADRKPLIDALGHALTTPAPFVFGKGVDLAATQRAVAAIAAAKDDAREAVVRAAGEQAVGWWLIGLDESPARAQATAKELVAAWNRAGMTKWMKEQAGKGSTPPALKVVPVAASLGLPKDTTHVELTIFPEAPSLPVVAVKGGAKGPKQPRPEKPVKLHAFVIPDGGRVWIAFGASDVLVASRVRAGLAGMPDSGTLGARAGLEGMKDARVSGGGFMSLRGILLTSPDAFEDVRRHRGGETLAPLAALADQGATPMTFTTTAAPGTQAAPSGSTRATLRIPKASVEGIVRLVAQHL